MGHSVFLRGTLPCFLASGGDSSRTSPPDVWFISKHTEHAALTVPPRGAAPFRPAGAGRAEGRDPGRGAGTAAAFGMAQYARGAAAVAVIRLRNPPVNALR